MNATITRYEATDFEYSVEFRRKKTGSHTAKSNNRPSHSRRGKAPQQFNGIHRRRKKKITW